MYGIVPLIVAALAVCLMASEIHRRAMRELAGAWRKTAKLVGGGFEPAGGTWWERTPMRITAKLEDVSVSVDHYTAQSGKSSTTYTRIAAAAAKAPRWLSLEIYEAGALSTIGKALGAQDVGVGHAKFDDAFVVKSSDEALARLWLGPSFCKAALASRAYALTLEKGKVESNRVGIEDDAERLARAMRAVALLAGRGRALRDGWRGLASELGGEITTGDDVWPSDDLAPISLAHRGVLLTIALDPEWISGTLPRVGTRVSAARAASAGEGFTLRRRAGSAAAKRAELTDPFDDDAFAEAYTLEGSDDDRALRRLTDELRQNILALAPAEITVDEDEVAVVLEGAEMRAKPIEAAIAIAVDLAAPSPEGPYR